MKDKPFLFPIFAVICSVIAGVIRGISLNTGYQADTKLHNIGDYFGSITIIFTIAFVIIMLIMLKKMNLSNLSFDKLFVCNSQGYKTLSVLCGMLLVVGGAFGLYLSIVQKDVIIYAFLQQSPIAGVPAKIAWILMIVSGVAFIAFSSAQSKSDFGKNNGFWMLVPVFWACLELVSLYNENAAQPTISIFTYGVIGRIALMYVFYSITQFVYTKGRIKAFVFSGCLAIYFILMDGISYFINCITNANVFELVMASAIKYVLLIIAVLYVAANIAIAVKNNKENC